MKRFFHCLVVLMNVFALTVNAQSTPNPLQIDVFYWGNPLASTTLPETRIRWFNLNDPDRVDQQAPEFRGDPTRAEQDALVWIQSSQGQQFTEALRRSYDGLLLAHQYGIKKTPAIVFNKGEAVVYGTTDIRRALLLYRQSRNRSHP